MATNDVGDIRLPPVRSLSPDPAPAPNATGAEANGDALPFPAEFTATCPHTETDTDAANGVLRAEVQGGIEERVEYTHKCFDNPCRPWKEARRTCRMWTRNHLRLDSPLSSEMMAMTHMGYVTDEPSAFRYVARTGRWLAMLCIGLLSAGCSRMSSQPDPYSILKAVADTYCDVRVYHVVWTVHLVAGTTGDKERLIRMLMARDSAGRFRREMAYLPAEPMVDVFDGQKEWTWFPERKQYVVSAPGSGPVSGRAAFEDVAERFCAVRDSRVRYVQWLRSETIAVAGRAYTCDVILVAPGMTYWVDRSRHEVVREEEVYSNGSRSEAEYSLIRLNEEPAAALFTSPVSGDAQRINLPASDGGSMAASWEDRHRRATERLKAATGDLERLWATTAVAKAAFEVGKPDEARRLASQALELAARFRQDSEYGNAIHDGHMVLGRVALKRGDLAAAKRELIDAGKTPGSPQLDTVGPNMSLAKDLLERNERDTVLAYFRLCEVFWEQRPTVKKWAAAVAQGEVPDFGPSLRY